MLKDEKNKTIRVKGGKDSGSADPDFQQLMLGSREGCALQDEQFKGEGSNTHRFGDL